VSAISLAAAGGAFIGAGGVGVAARKGSKYDRKIGHWRVDDNGQVTYKKVFKF
jgi:hypothetical protein